MNKVNKQRIIASLVFGATCVNFTIVNAAQSETENAKSVANETLSSEQKEISELKTRLQELEKKMELQIEKKNKEDKKKIEQDSKKIKDDRVRFSGMTRMRLDGYRDQATGSGFKDHNSSMYLLLESQVKLADGWSTNFFSESKTFMNTSDYVENSSMDLSTSKNVYSNSSGIYFSGPLFGTKADLGKFREASPGGFITLGNISGARFNFGDKLKTKIVAGRLKSTEPAGWDVMAKDSDGTKAAAYRSINLEYQLSLATKLDTGYYNVSQDGENVDIKEVGINTKVSKDWSVGYRYMGSNAKMRTDTPAMKKKFANNDTNGSITRIQYKEMTRKKPGSWDIFYQYMKYPYSVQTTTLNTWLQGKQINRYGFEHAMSKDMDLVLFYDRSTYYNDGHKEDGVRAQVRAFF
jgi:hypothetical protein